MLTKPDFRLDKKNPSPAVITDAAWWLWLRLHEMEPATLSGGFYAQKRGFHNKGTAVVDHGQGNSKTDYSIRHAINRSGAGMTHSSAFDWKFPDAQRGNYTTIDKYTSRLLKSALNPSDPRLDLILFEFYGQADSDKQVEGYDEYREQHATSDPSHLWHLHFSFLRSKCADFWGMWALLTVLMGWSVEHWRASLQEADIPLPTPPIARPQPAGLPEHRPGSRINRAGQSGTDIRVLQLFIGAAHMGPADGRAGDRFTAGVRWYQQLRGLTVDGVAGPKTWAPILKALR